MHKISGLKGAAPRRTSRHRKPQLPVETKEQRVDRIYRAPGGPLIGWLFDEAQRRHHTLQQMSQELGVTYGYISQLRTGIRGTENLSQSMCEAIARYVGTCTVVVKLMANNIRLSDFLFPAESEETVLDRALRFMQEDPKIRHVIPNELHLLPFEAKKALVLMHGEASNYDFFGARRLPSVLFWLQRAAVAHDENEFAAVAGHRDTDAR